MLKKCVLIFFILFSSLTAAIPSYAEESSEKKVEGIIPELPEPNEPEKEPQKDIIDSDLNCTKDMKYTEAQMKRLDQIYHRIYMDYIALIETYAWAGALTQDQKVLRYNMLKNYILTFQKRNYKWCSEYEEDEWEEEWYNNDND